MTPFDEPGSGNWYPARHGLIVYILRIWLIIALVGGMILFGVPALIMSLG